MRTHPPDPSDWDGGRPAGLTRLTSAQLVANAIRRMIFDRKLRAGDRLRQDEIAARLGVSRIPVREAVIALDREGWVRSEPHRGAYVNGLDENAIRDHYEMMGILYGFSARRTAERGDLTDIAKLDALNEALQEAADPDAFWLANSAFLRQLLVSSRSRRIMAIARVMTTSIVPGNFFAEVPGVMGIQKRDVDAVLEAIRAGAGVDAEERFVAMLRAEAGNAVELLGGRGLIDGVPPG